ncbi:RAD55 family ATPase [Thermococcus stetteri]|uniref:RAD55 family ATPase n=1 Tax=Thermococcus stetteri TaxID=49900 RepID=UPI001AE88547|nr:RAD55 family ATPase [Thermococcus stetteri]MBP1911379.1 KaiC/GvpD/RAD55 family RecA-like ATPase [Thermococcus stetteri]
MITGRVERISTGIEGFDPLIEGGLVKSKSYLITGPPGSGKTTFGIQFLVEGAKRGEKVVYISLIQDPEEVIKDYERFDPSVWNYVQKGNLILYDLGKEVWGPTAKPPQWSSIMVRIKDLVRESNINRLVIDPLTAIDFPTSDPAEKRAELATFLRTMSALGITSLLIAELTDLDRYSEEHYLVDGVIMLHYYLEGNDMARAIQVLKMRRTRHETKMYRLEFGPKGLVVRGPVL